MEKEYTKEELWKIFEKLPDELKESIFSEKTAESIFNICIRNGIEDERISKVAKYVGRVLMGLLPPNEFQETIERELNLEKEVAKSVRREVEMLIFYPVRTHLEEIYKIEIAPLARPTKITPPPRPEEKPPIPQKRDIYREPIE
jgi:hypothetical protein